MGTICILAGSLILCLAWISLLHYQADYYERMYLKESAEVGRLWEKCAKLETEVAKWRLEYHAICPAKEVKLNESGLKNPSQNN
jgi:hypothetical protein